MQPDQVENRLQRTFQVLSGSKIYFFLIVILGLPVHLLAWLRFKKLESSNPYAKKYKQLKEELLRSKFFLELHTRYKNQELKKAEFFDERISEEKLEETVQQLVLKRLDEEIHLQLNKEQIKIFTYNSYFSSLLSRKSFLTFSFLFALPMYILLAIYSRPYIRFIFERVIQSLFVIVGVTALVFTILYLSPSDPSTNILGEEATPQQIEKFNSIYHLDETYPEQLWNAVKSIVTFDLGLSYAGKENIIESIFNKFPTTFQIAFFSLLMAIIIAIPIGIISAVRPNSILDYTFMCIALLGLSIPNFWQGLIFILTFSINMQWFPATFDPKNWLTLIMPVVVLGTGITASIARMTRSSMLEVIHEDYITTAKAKGLSERRIIFKHMITNALIPIITLTGLQFAGLLGGAAVTEKIFNISGMGSYIIDKQYIPDIPAILGSVVYISITISIVALVIDIIYTFVDPRIRSQIKKV